MVRKEDYKYVCVCRNCEEVYMGNFHSWDSAKDFDDSCNELCDECTENTEEN